MTSDRSLNTSEGGPSVGDRFKSATRVVTESDMQVFAHLTGDKRPWGVSTEPEGTEAVGVRIAHGIFVLGVAFGLVDLDPARVALHRLHNIVFKRAVRAAEELWIEGRVDSVRMIDDDMAFVELTCVVAGQNDGELLTGHIDVLWRVREPSSSPEKTGSCSDEDLFDGELYL